MPRFLSVTNSDTTSSILVTSIIFAIVGLSIIIYILFSVFTMQNYYFSLKTQRETDRKVKMKHIKN